MYKLVCSTFVFDGHLGGLFGQVVGVVHRVVKSDRPVVVDGCLGCGGLLPRVGRDDGLVGGRWRRAAGSRRLVVSEFLHAVLLLHDKGRGSEAQKLVPPHLGSNQREQFVGPREGAAKEVAGETREGGVWLEASVGFRANLRLPGGRHPPRARRPGSRRGEAGNGPAPAWAFWAAPARPAQTLGRN